MALTTKKLIAKRKSFKFSAVTAKELKGEDTVSLALNSFVSHHSIDFIHFLLHIYILMFLPMLQKFVIVHFSKIKYKNSKLK